MVASGTGCAKCPLNAYKNFTPVNSGYNWYVVASTYRYYAAYILTYTYQVINLILILMKMALGAHPTFFI
jgi:hypothetical protein